MSIIRRSLPSIATLISIFATYSIASGTEHNSPVITHPLGAAAEPLHQRVLVKLTPAAAASAHRLALAIEAKARRVTAASAHTASANGTLQTIATRSNLIFEESREISPAGVHVLQVRSAAGEPLAATVARLRADPDVESADIDQQRYPHAVPNDPLYAGQWYEQATQAAGTDAVTAWDTSTGRSDIVIAVLDTGVRFDHPDLLAASANGRLLSGYDFISNAAVANDGDGRDSDPSDPGDWVTSADTQTAQFSGCTVTNSSWHGTRVSGILGALSNNGVGIAGMTWSPRIMPLRVLGKCGGVDSDILDAMRWAVGLHVSGVPDNTHAAQVVNLSLGGQGSCTSSQQTVINEVVATGATVVISAGNESTVVDSPANCTGVVAVAGLRQSGTKVSFSNLGPAVTLAAPGGNCVNSTGPCTYSLDTTTNSGTTTPASNGYTDQLNPNLGTSFSAPIVSGIAALMTSVNANLTSVQVISRLKEGAKVFPAAASGSSTPTCHVPASTSDVQNNECVCTTSTCGAGMANAPGALTAALRPIAAIAVPTTVTAGQNVSLSGAASGAACNRTITTYAWTNVGGTNTTIQGAATSTATIAAPASGTVTLKLAVTDDAGRTDSANVVVSSSAATSTAPAAANTGQCVVPGVSVSPTTSSVQAGGATQKFTAQVNATASSGVDWYVNGTLGGDSQNGTISTQGVYTPPAAVPSPNVVTVEAVWTSDTTKYATAQVTINQPVSVSVTPVLATVSAGSTQTFTATVTNAASTKVTWSVNGVAGGNSTVGTITAAGVYTAPAAVPSPATVTVTAASAQDANSSASATTTVTAASSTSSTGSSTGSSSSSSSSSSSGSSGGGGGPMDVLTLFACALMVAFVANRRQSVCRVALRSHRRLE